MLSSFLCEGLFDPSPFDQLPFPQNIYGRLGAYGWEQEIKEAEKELSRQPNTMVPKNDADVFYNGLGKKFGYSNPDELSDPAAEQPELPIVRDDLGNVCSPHMNGIPMDVPFNIPWEIK